MARFFIFAVSYPMTKIVSLVASGLFLAYLVTELSVRFFPGQYFTLLVLIFLSLMLQGLYATRQQLPPILKRAEETPRRDNQQRRQTNKSEAKNDNRKRNDRDRGRRNNREQDDRKPRSDNRKQKNRGQNDQKRDQNAQRDTQKQAPAPQAEPAKLDGPVEQGEVKWFNRSKGYGFVVRPNGEEIFVHQRSILSGGSRPVLRDGQRVEFTVTTNERGAQAEQVKPLDS